VIISISTGLTGSEGVHMRIKKSPDPEKDPGFAY